MLSTFASGQSCGKAWKSVVQVKHAKLTGSYAIVPSADHVENGCTACVVRATHAHKKSTVFLRLVKLRDASHVVPVPNNQIVLKSRTVDQPPSNFYRLGQTTDIVVPDTTDLFFNYFPAPPSFNPQNAREYLAEELSRPVIPSDVHSGSLDPDPLPQDSKEHHFQTIKTSKKHSL
jgi:hypothetical protein